MYMSIQEHLYIYHKYTTNCAVSLTSAGVQYLLCFSPSSYEISMYIFILPLLAINLMKTKKIRYDFQYKTSNLKKTNNITDTPHPHPSLTQSHIMYISPSLITAK